MKQKTILLLAPALLLLACGKKKADLSEIPQTDVIPVKIQLLESKNSAREIEVSGQFSTNDETYLSFLSGGIIQEMTVQEGDHVRKGQILAKLDVTAVKAQVEQAKIGRDKAKRDLERANNLYKLGYATLEQSQNAQSGLDLAEEQLRAAEYALRYTEIRALSDGFVLKKMANKGQLVGSGSPVYLTNSAGKKNWKLKVGVSDREWSQIHEGDVAEIETEVLRGAVLKARVSRKSESVDPYSGTFTVELELQEDAPANLATGIFAKARIKASGESRSWMIPYSALLDGNGREGFVFVTDDGQTARKIPVRIGQIRRNKIEIISGLEQSKRLIVSGSAYLNEGSKISIIK